MELELITGCATLIALAVVYYLLWAGAFGRRRAQASGAPSSIARRRDVDAARPRRNFQGDNAGRSINSSLPQGEGGKRQEAITLPSRAEQAGRAAAAAATVEMQAARAAAAAASEARAAATTVSRRPGVQAAAKYHGRDTSLDATASRQGNGVPQMDVTASSEEKVGTSSAGGRQWHHHQQEGASRRDSKDGQKRLKLARATGVLSSISGIPDEDLSSLAPKLRVLSLEVNEEERICIHLIRYLCPMIVAPEPSRTMLAIHHPADGDHACCCCYHP